MVTARTRRGAWRLALPVVVAASLLVGAQSALPDVTGTAGPPATTTEPHPEPTREPTPGVEPSPEPGQDPPGQGRSTFAPDVPPLTYEGRWDVRPSEATTVTSGSSLSFAFSGTSLRLVFEAEELVAPGQVYVTVDGRRHGPLTAEGTVVVAEDLAEGTHTAEIVVKDVDARFRRWRGPLRSAVRLGRLDLDEGARIGRLAASRRAAVTFLGDSITQGIALTCGRYGSDCADASLSYPRLVADRLDARLEQVGYARQGVTTQGQGGVPRARRSLGLNYARSPAAGFAADVVVINQGTNDSFTEDRRRVRRAFVLYLRAVVKRYRSAVVLALGPLGADGRADLGHADVRRAVRRFDHPRVRYVSTRGWTSRRHFTDQVHPNIAGHRQIASRLLPLVREAISRR